MEMRQYFGPKKIRRHLWRIQRALFLSELDGAAAEIDFFKGGRKMRRRAGMEAVVDAFSLAVLDDEIGVPEDGEMMGDRGLLHFETVDQLRDISLPPDELAQEAEPRWIRHGLQDLGAGDRVERIGRPPGAGKRRHAGAPQQQDDPFPLDGAQQAP